MKKWIVGLLIVGSLAMSACSSDLITSSTDENTVEEIETLDNTEEEIDTSVTKSIQGIKDTDYAKDWLEENGYLTFPGWEIEALSDLYEENAASFKMQFIDQTYSVTGVISTIESDHIELISKSDEDLTTYYYYVSAYLPIEEIAKLSQGDSITVVGYFAESESGENDTTGWMGLTFSECFVIIEDATIYIPDEETEYSTGDKIITDYFEVTLDNVEFASSINVDFHRKIFVYRRVMEIIY